jgi:hypothetical protein
VRRERWQAKELAREFHRQLRGQPDLAGCVVHQPWVEEYYPVFCDWLRVTSAPPYRDFARELARIMRRERKDNRRGRGPDRVGDTCTVYCIGSRAAAGAQRPEVVDLEVARAARAEAQDAQPAQRALES